MVTNDIEVENILITKDKRRVIKRRK